MALAGPFLSFSAQKVLLCLCRGSISGSVGSFQSEVFAGQRGMTVESLLMSGCGQGCEPQETLIEETLAQVSSGSYQQKRKLASFSVLPNVQFLIACSVQNIIYHINDVSVYIHVDRQRGGGVPPQKNAFCARVFHFEPEAVCFLLHERSKLQHFGQKP